MVWWKDTTQYIYESGLDDPDQKPVKISSFWERINDIFFQEAVDALFFFLGIFTYIYLFAVAFIYLSGISSVDSIASKILKALAEPYLGGVGIYTILKEARKRRYALSSRHWGEFFVMAWLGLLAICSLLAVISPFYTFTHTLELMITVSLSIGIIYIGSAVHKP